MFKAKVWWYECQLHVHATTTTMGATSTKNKKQNPPQPVPPPPTTTTITTTTTTSTTHARVYFLLRPKPRGVSPLEKNLREVGPPQAAGGHERHRERRLGRLKVLLQHALHHLLDGETLSEGGALINTDNQTRDGCISIPTNQGAEQVSTPVRPPGRCEGVNSNNIASTFTHL